MKKPKPQKPPLTDAERHKRFVEVAKKVGASDDIAEFDRAFEKVTKPSAARSRHSAKPTSS
jgi:hypothetical protein